MALATLIVGATAMLAAAPASAHVVPATSIGLDIHEDHVAATIDLPAGDLTTASGVPVPAEGELTAAQADDILRYLADHLEVTSDAGTWQVELTEATASTTEQWGTGSFRSVIASATLTPPAGGDVREFTLDYDAIIHQVVTSDIVVVLHNDWSTGQVETTRDLGVISLDTASGTVAPLVVDLDGGSAWQGFAGMFGLGMSHIAEGTDHQLFLLTLLLPAPLLVVGRRWRGVVPARTATRRITLVTLAFTVGHSLTLILGTLGLPVPQQPVEALIAVSIIVAAVHAIRPIFPGREALVAGAFGLIHGMAFSMTLSALDLSGGQLALSLLGFNLGIEAMQLVVVLVVLPPLVILARTRAYTALRTGAATVTAIAALGWFLARVGVDNPVAQAADAIGVASVPIAICLWGAAITVLIVRAMRTRGQEDATVPEVPVAKSAASTRA